MEYYSRRKRVETRLILLIQGMALLTYLFLTSDCKDTSAGKKEEGRLATLAALLLSDGYLSFEEFKAQAFLEPFEGGVYIVNGDTPLAGEKQLRSFYDSHFGPESGNGGTLIVHRINGDDAAWDSVQKTDLTYCVSASFGSNYNRVVQAMNTAVAAWEGAANIGFRHVSSQDSNCTRSNNNVLFDVNPVNVNGQYLARAFFPLTGRSQRNVLIDNSSFRLSPSGNLTLEGILRHELGHVLGFRHEHTRPDSGACFEDNQWRALTVYDSDSVMHYPQCNGTGNSSLTLTDLDKIGASRLYGAAGGGGTPPSTDTNQTFNDSLVLNQEKQYGPFIVEAGSVFQANITGSGDADLYVRFGNNPTRRLFHCRPFIDGSDESCSLDVPAGQSRVFVMVRGFRAAAYELNIRFRAGSESGVPVGSLTESMSGGLFKNQAVLYGPFTTQPGGVFKANMNGFGDADLYVRFGAAPTLGAFDCRPYKTGALETCNLSVPAGQNQVFVLVHGFTNSIFSLDLVYTAP